MQSDSASMMKLDNSTLCSWQAEQMSHALVTAAFMEAARLLMTAMDTVRLLADHRRI